MSDLAISIHALSKRFGRHEVLGDVTLDVPVGKTYAFLGRNGAGKTTTIRILMGLLSADGGQSRVLGLDSARDAMEIRRRVGYLAEDQKMFGWMRIEELLAFLAPFYPTWDMALARSLLKQFSLPARAKVEELSKGQNVRLGLLLAMAHRPELVILDDPTMGLDPIIRKDFLRDVVGSLQGEGITVFFSSHLLYELEPVADGVVILEGGRIVLNSPTERLRERIKRLILPASQAQVAADLPGLLDIQTRGGQVAAVVEDGEAALAAAAARGAAPMVVDLNLDEIFEAYVIGRQDGQHNVEPVAEGVA
jgi:ABC-2 type transport system ATP-binding protein